MEPVTETPASRRLSGGMLPRLVLCAGVFLLLGGWLVWGRHIAPSPSMNARLVYSWGMVGAQPGELNKPRAIKVMPDGTLFVIDRSGRIQHFTREGHCLGGWHFPAWGNGTPTSVNTDAQGNLIIANTHYSQILIYSQQGKLLRVLGQTGDGARINMPTDAHLGPDGLLYILERPAYDDKILKYTLEGKSLGEIGSSGSAPGQFIRPNTVQFDPKGRMWIADSCNHRVEVLDTNGKYLQGFGQYGHQPGQLNYPYGLGLGPHGEVVLAEYGNCRVQIFSASGKPLGVIGHAGSGPLEFASPWAIDIDRQGLIWVADYLNNRIQAIQVDWPKG